MDSIRSSISTKLTAINMLVSGTALLLACAAFFAYDLVAFRQTILSELSTQAQIIGINSISPLIFNDPRSAEMALSALRASPHITFAGIYNPNGKFFAGYWRDTYGHQSPSMLPPPNQLSSHWIRERRFEIEEPIFQERQLVGHVYISSDIQALSDRLQSYLAILAGILLASLTAALLVSRAAQRSISRPIVSLADTARRVSRDKNYALRAIATTQQDEIGLLIGAFNEMLSEIQKRDSALQESEQQFRLLADSVPQLAWMADPDGYLTWYNQRWYEYTGLSPKEVEGWGWQRVQDPRVLPEVLANWRVSLEKGEPFQMVFPLRKKDGMYRDFLTLALPVRDAHGKIVRWFGTNTDITEQRRSEEALRTTEKLAATGRLAASIAHEINNPLEAVTNLLYLARNNPQKGQTYISQAEQELERISDITRHTLGFFRDTSRPISVNLSEVLDEVLALYRRKLDFKQIIVEKRYDAETQIVAFPGELRQIFANLVVNAIEAMGQGGRLTIKIAPGREWGGRRRSGVRVTVCDTGSGIDSAAIAKIFEAFYTTKQDVGTGLGLWLTHNLVDKHHGTIGLRSRTATERHGTLFSIFLPDRQSVGPELTESLPLSSRQPNGEVR